jgi:hypothetical protein
MAIYQLITRRHQPRIAAAVAGPDGHLRE